MSKDTCPVCGENEVTTVAIPDRKIFLSPVSNKNEEGDKVRCDCSFCGWWSESTYSRNAPAPLTHHCGPRCYTKKPGIAEPVNECKHKDSEAYRGGPGWVTKTSPAPNPRQRERLEERLKKVKKLRRKIGHK